jgi:beta-phosphoglucomutase-like phosphatase (HAD superfamily)
MDYITELKSYVENSIDLTVWCAIQNMPQNYFRETVAAGDIARTKPFPDPYLHAAKLLNVEIENCLIFEDSPTGITAATASGAFVVAIPHFIEIAESTRLKRVKSFLDLTHQDLDRWWEISQHERDKSL